MTISTTTNRVTYTGNGVTVAFSFPYAFFAQADLVVVETIIATGVQTVKTLTTHYTISGSVDALGHYSSGGTVTANTAPASGKTWTIYRDPTATQTTDLVENDPMPAESLEAALDYQTMLNQRTRDLVNRSLRQPDGDSTAMAVLPSKVDRASKYAAWDANGNMVGLTDLTAATAVLSGTWTPVLTCATPGDLSVVYALQTGTYMYVGGFLWLSANLICTPTFTTATGQIKITGSPYDTATSTTDIGLVNMVNAAAASAYKSYSCYMETPNTLQLNKVSHDVFTPLNIADCTTAAEIWIYLSVVLKAA